MTNLDKRVEDAFPLINKVMAELENAPKEDAEDDRIKKAMKDMVPSTVTGYYEITEFWKEHTQGMGKTDDEVMHEIYEWTWDEMGVSNTKERDEVAKRTSIIVDDVIKNNKDDMTFDDMIDQLKGKKEDQVNELEPDAEPIDAPIEPPVDHAPIVQSFLTDPDKKLVLRKDDSADKMLKVTKFTDKNTMLSSILSDIASRLLTKSGEEDRVANFASRVADEMEQEKSSTFKPTPDYMKNKKIAIQLAKRYIDDYKKMEKDPEYEKEVRMEPGAFAPKKDLKGKAKEQEAFENWVDNVGEATIKPYVSMYKGDDGKMIYDVLDKDSKSAFKSGDYKAAEKYLHQNYDKLKEQDVQEGHYPHIKSFDKLYGINDMQQYKDMADDAQSMDMEEFSDTYGSAIDMAGDFWQDHQKVSEDTLDEYAKTDFESWLQRNYKRGVKGLGAQEYSDMVRKYKQHKEREAQMQKAGILKKEQMSDKAVDKFHTELDKVVHKHIGHSSDEKKEKEDMKKEGNEFALAVQKAKAAGMKAGDKFKVGDKEYTLKDAIELAGLQLEEFFSEEEIAYDNQIDRIKNLAFYQ